MSIRSWLKEGNVVGVDFSYRELPEKLVPYDYDAFLGSDTEFYTVVTNVETASAEYIKLNDMLADIDFIRASASLPYFSRIVDINGGKYLDGGCADSVPVDAFIERGFTKNVVVLTRPESYRKKPELAFLADIVYRKYPEFAKLLKLRHEEYNRNIAHIAELEKEGKVFVIRPESDLNLGRIEHDAEKLKNVYDIGVADAKKCIDDLKNWLLG
jgi:predicted patatin/cPLA2 family phospholipase